MTLVPVPGALLRVIPEWAEAMDVVFTVGEQWSTDPEGLYGEGEGGGLGYVARVDRDGEPLDETSPSLLYRLAVSIGAQAPVKDWWGKP